MKINQIFLSINARNFDALSDWWARLIGRTWDNQPMPSCHEWQLTGDIVFQVLDNPDVDERMTVTLHVSDLDIEIARLASVDIAVPDPVKIEGFDTLRFAELKDPEGNTVGLLDGS